MSKKLQNNVVPPPPPYYMYPRKTRWWIPVIIIVAVLFIIALPIFGLISLLSGSFEHEAYQVKPNTVLTLNFNGKLEERTKDSPFDLFGVKSQAKYTDVLKAIHRAKNDSRIKGIVIKNGLAFMGFAKAEELQQALDNFKTSGKFIYSYMDYGRELDYYLSLPADKIFMPREGVIELNGFSITSTFYKGLLDKIGIKFYVLGFEDFKSAGDQYDKKKFTDSSRYQLRVLLNQRYDHFVNATAKYRKLDNKFIKNALNRGIYTPDSLVSLGFIDGLMYETDFKDMIKTQILGKQNDDKTKDTKVTKQKKWKRKKVRYVSVANYIQDLPVIKDKSRIADKDKQIAVIYASGMITQAQTNGFSNELIITAKQLIKDLKSARENDKIKAIILRVDSPGGSVLISDKIYNEILKTKKVKPIYSSMSDVAASGGYYISAPCDTIIAEPSTITGSIGVIMAVPNMSGLMKKLDLSVDTISTGPAANMLNTLIPFKDRDKKQLKKLARNVYDRFINKVAKHRHKTYDEVRAIAKGRVWTGEDAYKRGLVDVLGGFDKALSIAKSRIGVADSDYVIIQEYPRPQNKISKILKLFGLDEGNDDDDAEVKNSKLNELANYLGIKPDIFIPYYNSMPENVKGDIKYMINMFDMSKKENIIMAMPQNISIK